MHSKRIRLGLLACASFLVVLSAGAISPPAAPTPLPTPLPVPTAVPTQTINPDESLPVVINYGQGQETRVQIYRGVMDAVGLLRNQVVTVTTSLTTAAWPVRRRIPSHRTSSLSGTPEA